MNPQEALAKVKAANPDLQFNGNACETNSKYLFVMVPSEDDDAIDAIYSVDKSTGEVDHYVPVGDPEFGFDNGMKQLDI